MAAAQPLLVLLKGAVEWLHCPAFNLPEFIYCGGDEVLVVADHQYTALEGCQALCTPTDSHTMKWNSHDVLQPK